MQDQDIAPFTEGDSPTRGIYVADGYGVARGGIGKTGATPTQPGNSVEGREIEERKTGLPDLGAARPS